MAFVWMNKLIFYPTTPFFLSSQNYNSEGKKFERVQNWKEQACEISLD